jgi:hypothetical protein
MVQKVRMDLVAALVARAAAVNVFLASYCEILAHA